jgi:Major Facilitator Superfamily
VALTEDVQAKDDVTGSPEKGGGFWGRPWVLVALVVVLLLALSWGFIKSPTVTAPTRDPAWYTWRANVVIHDSPGLIVQDWGPFSVFSGGYRVSVPTFAAILNGVAGIGTFQFSGFMMIGIPILAGLAMGAFGYRSRRDPLLLLLTVLAAAGLFLTTPYVGYLDNITMLFVVAMILAFIPSAQTSWGSRVALFMLGILAAFTHPTTCVLVGASLFLVFVFRVITARGHLADAFKRHGPALMSVGFGIMFGLAMWFLPLWGHSAPLADSALPPPYDRSFFNDRLLQWVLSMKPMVTFTLAGLAIVATIWAARQLRKPADTYSVTSIWYLFPYIGVAGALTAKALPYYRFMNSTAAIMVLCGLGAWIAVRWFVRRRGGAKIPGYAGAVLVVLALVYVFVVGAFPSTGGQRQPWVNDSAQWISQDTRTALVAASGVIEREPGVPIVFLENFADTRPPTGYGWAKTFTNVARTGIPGDSVIRSAAYFGTLDNFVKGVPTKFTYDALLDSPEDLKTFKGKGLSEGYMQNMDKVLARYDAPPLVFAIREFNKGENAQAIFPSGCLTDQNSPAGDEIVPLGCDIGLVSAPGVTTTPSQQVIASAQRSGLAQQQAFENAGGIFGDPLHLLRVLIGLVLILVVPGLLAARFFDLEGFLVRFSLIPGISIAMVILSGIVVAAIWRGPFDAAHAWVALGLAIGLGAALALVGVGVLSALTRLGGFFNSMFSSFSNYDFSVLMGMQFLAQVGQGIVQGAIGKSIAFGGQKGFDVSNVPSADYLLKVVLYLYVPYTLLSPFIGVFIDRFPRRRVVWWTNVITGVIVAAVAVTVLIPLGKHTSEGDVTATVALILGLLAAQACVRVALAVKSAAIPDVLSGKDLLQANGLSQAGGALFQIVGIGFAFGATAALPAWIVVVVGGAVLIVAALVARRMRHAEAKVHDTTFSHEASRVVRNIVAGLKEVAARPPAALGLSSFQMLRYQFWGFGLFVFALYAKNLVQGNKADTLSLALSGLGGLLGGGLGMVLAQRWKDRIPPIRLLLASMILLGAGTLVFGLWVSVGGFAGMLFVGFFSFFLGKISADTITQQAMPDDFRGRAFALFDIAYNLGFIVPALILSLIWIEGDAARTRAILVVSGIVFLGLTALIAMWARRIRDQFMPQDDLPPDKVAEGELGSTGR